MTAMHGQLEPVIPTVVVSGKFLVVLDEKGTTGSQEQSADRSTCYCGNALITRNVTQTATVGNVLAHAA
jgi:hypothetical protein